MPACLLPRFSLRPLLAPPTWALLSRAAILGLWALALRPCAWALRGLANVDTWRRRH